MKNYKKEDIFNKLCLIQDIALNMKDKNGENNSPKLDIALKCELEKANLLGLLKETDKNNNTKPIIVRIENKNDII